MDFANNKIDPYEVLGVPFGSTIEVCKAVFKSLTKIYHPDIFVGDKQYAEKRMAELAAAFEFLKNPKQKKEFDDAAGKHWDNERKRQYEPNNESEEFSKASISLRDNWDFVCKFHPELRELYNDLESLSIDVAFLFMAVIVEGKFFSEAKKLAKLLEDEFLTSNFGIDDDLKKIAKLAIVGGKIEFAKYINRAVKLLGDGSKDVILRQLATDYPETSYYVLRDASLYNLIPNDNPLKIRDSEIRKAKFKELNKKKEKSAEQQEVYKYLIEGERKNRDINAIIIFLSIVVILTVTALATG